MKTDYKNQGSGCQEPPVPSTPTNRRNSKSQTVDPNQTEFGIIWRLSRNVRRLRAGDVVLIDNRLCRVIRVNECAAVVIMNRPLREFKTRFDKPVRFQPPPAVFRISPHSEVPILNRKVPRK